MFRRELTEKEKRMIRQSVIHNCACYDVLYGCLPLDSDCYMMKIGFTNSSLCRYYEYMVLPEELEISKILSSQIRKTKFCRNCGTEFYMNGNKQYCSNRCSLIARRKATAERMRRSRRKKV